jgi:hypothetical protein
LNHAFTPPGRRAPGPSRAAPSQPPARARSGGQLSSMRWVPRWQPRAHQRGPDAQTRPPSCCRSESVRSPRRGAGAPGTSPPPGLPGVPDHPGTQEATVGWLGDGSSRQEPWLVLQFRFVICGLVISGQAAAMASSARAHMGSTACRWKKCHSRTWCLSRPSPPRPSRSRGGGQVSGSVAVPGHRAAAGQQSLGLRITSKRERGRSP